MNKYELGIIIRPDLDEEGQRTEMDRVKALIDRFGGTIEKLDEWGKRRLAYPIQKLGEGVYTFITFQSESNAPSEIENRLRLMENVLRFLIIRKDENESVKPLRETLPKEQVVEQESEDEA